MSLDTSGVLPTRTEDGATLQRRRLNSLLAECTEINCIDSRINDSAGPQECEPSFAPNASAADRDFKQSRAKHLEKIMKPKAVTVVKTKDAKSKTLSGRWVDTQGDDGELKSRWTTRVFEQTLSGDDNFYSGTSALCHLKAMLVLTEKEGHVVALCYCSGVFSQSPLEEDVCLLAPQEAGFAPDECWKAVCAFPGLKGAPRA